MAVTKAKPQSKLTVDGGLADFVRLEIGASMRQHRGKELNCAPMSNSEIQGNIVTVQLDEVGKHLSGLSDSVSSLQDKVSPYIAQEIPRQHLWFQVIRDWRGVVQLLLNSLI